jgi:hypothetical protein
MKKQASLICATLLLALLTIAQSLPEAKVTLRVLSEEGTPIANADAAITFDQPQHKRGAWGSSDVVTRSGKTDGEGLFSSTAASGNYVSYGAKAAGYYDAHGKPVEFSKSERGKWQPWNPTVETVLKKIANPIPMYARRVETQIPALDAPIGFDLIESDWVAPNGHGKVSDLVFKVTKRVISFHDFGAELLLTFFNKGDGIKTMLPDKIGVSQLRSPHIGPEVGYAPSLSLLQGNFKERGEYGTKGNREDYFIRVRTVMDSRGEVTSALYGKIYGRTEYFPVSYKTAKLRFTYYLNPTPNDRNVEFDPKRNLFTNLKPDEQVREP